ncbi:MAG: hypothetical protein OJF51_003465 [Nitrospira sp.]|nr:MAG: hypothetical protein OJF51_003465 [Nitrospira sp.]
MFQLCHSVFGLRSFVELSLVRVASTSSFLHQFHTPKRCGIPLKVSICQVRSGVSQCYSNKMNYLFAM